MAEYTTGKVVYHEAFGTGRVVNVEDERVVVNFIKAGAKFFMKSAADAELSDTPLTDEEEEMDTSELKEAIRAVLREEGVVGAVPEIAEKWDGGELIMKPGRPGLQEKSVPIDTFFHKIVMLRNQLRLLEQNINSTAKLTDGEKVELQQYITRCYGTLTTFNALFADKDDWFVGMKKE
jgi:hypothetical protein